MNTVLRLLSSFKGALGRSNMTNEAAPLLADVSFLFRDRFRDGGRGLGGEGEALPLTIASGVPEGVTSFTAGDGLEMGPLALSSTSRI